MGWSDWFSGSNDGGGSDAKFKNSIDSKDGSFRSERLTRDTGSKEHFHDIAKGSTDGKYKEIYTDKH
jgi:hypothetical protein